MPIFLCFYEPGANQMEKNRNILILLNNDIS